MTIVGSAEEHWDSESDAFASQGLAVMDSSEVRWFAPGPMPADVLTWLTRLSTITVVEERCDTYLLHGIEGLGVKYRNQSVLEVKRRHSTAADIELGPGMRAPFERWQKWHPEKLDVAWSGPDISRLDVHKLVTKATFTLNAGAIVPTELPDDLSQPHCSVEVASVVVNGVPSWTFAFEALGPMDMRRRMVQRTWQTVSSKSLPDLGLIGRLEVAAAYSDWLEHDLPRQLAG